MDRSPTVYRGEPDGLGGLVACCALVVDDDQVSRVLLCAVLEKFGYRAVGVEDGESALDVLHGGAIHLLITDVHLPGLSGLEVASVIRREESLSGHRLPIIGYTADVRPSELLACLDSGMDGVLTKPFRFCELRHLLDRWIGACRE